MIESIEKLRKWVKSLYTPNSGELKVEGLDIADEIEAEIESRYMELPVDADGVPIHPNDKLEHVTGMWTFTADTLEVDRWGAHVRPNGQARVQCANCRHVKPRTIEDVLTDFANEVARQGHQIGLTGHELTMRYADEIRELMEVDE